ncbi:hypothetical protein GobsT_12240 [Gemmata obscuriglobus]|uniref:Uncharacterized protein n=1 Tax=Gemmata obscuriglobus TaxID=114 RepID=A0A2Z3H9V0_9BACT|nr:hypothetical protein [Gemmata obscuriglobus]AWM40307.1 hypothetical protein C1280_27090 [Gemmata obscuriglobus]QEG26484.1 hypothetical protein GobsT_12240 [Gemmata obscuriglobus]VTS01741.1 unnamed protein product [Gemmata obscuriglobus UQM 2246]
MRTPGALTARYAVLVNVHRLRMHEVLDLTPRQVHELYFHPRDRDGAIQLPEGAGDEPADRTARLAQLIALGPALGVPPEQIEELKRRLGAVTDGDTGPTA